jgi:sulfur-oxidizing protein SoxZ
VLEAQLSQAVSKNPFLNFRVRGAKPGDKIMVGWVDNRGEKASMESTLD